MGSLPSFTGATIQSAGPSVPSYNYLESFEVASATSIFGADIYLANDSQDFQLIACFCKVANDVYQFALLIYACFSPLTATGTALDQIVALNGLSRLPASYSICPVTLTGSNYAVITNGIVADNSGNNWALPTNVTLSGSGTATVTATCQTLGAIQAGIGDITQIVTPTFGWTSVTNTTAATPGQAVETDSALRLRQQISVANPSQALTAGVLGAVLSTPDIISAQIYENDTSAWETQINGSGPENNIVGTGGTGFPPNSLTLVVNGGIQADIANAIYVRKTPGCYTNGSIDTVLYDQFGNASTIRYYPAIASNVWIDITINPLATYSSTIGTQIISALVTFVNANQAGQPLYNSELVQTILSINPPRNPYFTLTSCTSAFASTGLTSGDLIPDFQHYTVTQTSQITLTT